MLGGVRISTRYHPRLLSYLPLRVWKIVVNTLAPAFLIGSSSFFSGNEDNQQVWTEFEFWPDRTKRCRVTALDKCQKLVFAQYLENGWTEFNQILYTHYHWQDLCCYSKASFFANLQRSYSPWLMSEIGFCSISWEWMDRIQPNFVYTWSSTRSILIS